MLAHKNNFEESPRIKLNLPASQNVKMLLLKKSNDMSLSTKKREEPRHSLSNIPAYKPHQLYKTLPEKF